jgi:hypothetical protein
MRVPITRITCDTPDCESEAILEQRDDAPGWFVGKFGDHCPEHADEERERQWRPFKGPVFGTPGWQSLLTSRILYQTTCPTRPEAHEGHSAVESE